MIFFLIKGDKCPKCGGKMKVDEVKDDFGFNITKKITVGLRYLRRVTIFYRCDDCGAMFRWKDSSSKYEEMG